MAAPRTSSQMPAMTLGAASASRLLLALHRLRLPSAGDRADRFPPAARLPTAFAARAALTAALTDRQQSGAPGWWGNLLQPHTHLGRYELLIPIASGGMAEVWLARLVGHKGFAKLVAIKTMRRSLEGDPHYERMFVREATLASQIQHPNVCAVHELGEDRGRLFMAMQWVEGGSMCDLLHAGGPIDARIAARIAADACGGLHATHELRDGGGRPLGPVHLDVSPENILVSVGGTVKMTDFGIARLACVTDSSRHDWIRGKASYMSPEQASGEPVDRRSDVFALGCVLYEATTGALPFQGKTLIDVVRAVLNGHFVPPAIVTPNCPRELSRIIEVALAPAPAQRFSTAEEMQMALETWLVAAPLVTQTELREFVCVRLASSIDANRSRLRAVTALFD